MPEADFPQLRAPRLALERSVETWQTTVVEPGLDAVRGGQELTEAELEASRMSFDEVRTALDDYRDQLLAARADSVAELTVDVRLLFGVLVASLVLLMVSAALVWVALRRWVTRPLERLGDEVDRVERGELSRTVVASADAPEEVRVLAEQVDRMRLRILEEYSLSLESRAEALEARALVEEQAEDLRRSNAELEQFAYVASHDLQEPLRKVASFCQLIERRYKGQLDERGDQYIEFAVDGAKRMQQLINDLLAFSRVGRATRGFEAVDLERVLAQALRQLEAGLEESDGVVTHDPLPTVEGDASLLVQLFQNLIGNGLKFRSDDSPAVHIAVRMSPGHAGFWEFTCADNGIGIDPQYEDKIFVIFQRLHGRDTYGGTGIGLAMCKKIVEHHGGRLWLDTDGRSDRSGTTFRWTLPIEAGEQAPRPPEEHEGTADDRAARAADRDLARGGRPG
jgi:signal transduction histidine kinase